MSKSKPAKPDREIQLEKKLLRKPQTLEELANKVGGGVTMKHFTLAAASLVKQGKAVKHEGRPPKYSKPAAVKAAF